MCVSPPNVEYKSYSFSHAPHFNRTRNLMPVFAQDIICGVSTYILTLYTFPILPTRTFHPLNTLTTLCSIHIRHTSDFFPVCVTPAHRFRLIFDLNNSERSGPARETMCPPLSRFLPVPEPESFPPSQQPARTLCPQSHKYRSHALCHVLHNSISPLAEPVFRKISSTYRRAMFYQFFSALFDPCVQVLLFFTAVTSLGVHKSWALSRPSD
jgi:hypothetical protein